VIRVERAPEPPDFHQRVRVLGNTWLAKGSVANLPSYWRRATRPLREAFGGRCGYTAMWLSAPGTVDHFVSRSEDRALAYEWSNLRYAASWINSSKSDLRADQVLDPFEVGDDWFEIRLPQCEMFLTERCPAEYRERAQTMLGRLKLGKGEDVVEFRLEWYRMFLLGELTLDGLERRAPLIARAIRKDRARLAGAEAARD
jgi:hypothetical protein